MVVVVVETTNSWAMSRCGAARAGLADLACMTGGPHAEAVAVCLAAGLGARGGICAQVEVRTLPAAVPGGRCWVAGGPGRLVSCSVSRDFLALLAGD
jgi:hypothetical protein